jgi:MFS family permease
VSVFGSQFYLIAMPLAAVMILDATAYEMGILFSLEMLPFLLFGLLAGVLADRRRRKAIMIICDFGRAAVLAIVPLSWYFDALSLPVLYVVAFVAGTFTAFFDIAYQAYLPVLVKRSELLDANSKLETSRASSQVAGPGIAGLMVSAIGAPLAITGNSLSVPGAVPVGSWRDQRGHRSRPLKQDAERHSGMHWNRESLLGDVVRDPHPVHGEHP